MLSVATYWCVLLVLARHVSSTHEVLSANDTTTDENAREVYFNVCELPVVKNADLTENRTSYIEGERAEMRCSQGYREQYTRSDVIHLVCNKDGDWQSYLGQEDLPTCQRIGGCQSPDILNSRLIDHGGDFMPGDVIPIMCRPGYQPSVTGSHSLIVCQYDGSWGTKDGSSDLPTCQMLMCRIPAEFPHGSIKIELNPNVADLSMLDLSPDVVPDSSYIQYSCDRGYSLDNPRGLQLKCTHGAWSQSPPNCISELQFPGCRPPQKVHHGSYMYTIDGSILAGNILPEGTVAKYHCEVGFSPYQPLSEYIVECVAGRWLGQLPTCVPRTQRCEGPPRIAYGNFTSTGTERMVDSSKLPRGSPYIDASNVYYYCNNGYRLQNTSSSSLQCVQGHWRGLVPKCERRTHCDRPLDIPNGNWVINMYLPGYPIKSQVLYECHEGYKAIGSTQIECLASGYWSDYAPRCLAANKYCSEPGPIDNGVYMCRPSHCDLFKIGTEVHYVCNKNYDPKLTDVMVQKCLIGGVWSGQKPQCQRELATVKMNDGPLRMNTSTLTVVIATSCGVLGLLVIVMVVVALKRRHKPRSSRACHPSTPPPPPYPSPPSGLVDDPDRVALIAFADGVQVVLPSYEESTRGGRPGSRLARYNSDSARGSIRSSASRGDYRPLPSLPPSMRNGGPQIREIPPDHHRDHHRNSIITTTSITTRDNLSLTLGSMDTVNISDGTSTSVTVDTASSNPSIATSQHAAAGSIESSSTNGSLANEDAPLLDQQNHYNSETMRSHHSTTSDTLHNNATRCQCADRTGYDTLRSIGSRSAGDSSPIVEVPEEQKEA